MNRELPRIQLFVGFLGLLLMVDGAQAADCGATVAACVCGDTVVENYTLSNDLICPAGFTGHALTLGADNITLDGGGFKIEAPDAQVVIQNTLYSDWTLQNITLRGGFFGIQSDGRAQPGGVRGISILDVDASSPEGFGQRIRFLATHQSQVVDSQADGGDIGLYNLNGDQNQVRNTSASWLPTYGPLPPDTGLPGQNQVGVQLIGARDNLLDGITVHGRRLAVDLLGDTGNSSWGSRTSDRNTVQDSDLSGNGGGISFWFEGNGNQFLRNDLSDSAVASIGESGGSLNFALQVNGDSGVVIAGNEVSGSFNGIVLSNIDAAGRSLLSDAQLTSLNGTYGLRLVNVHQGRFERIEIDGGPRQSLWWSGGSSGNEFREITARGHTFGLLSQDSHSNRVFDSDFSWTGGGQQATGIDLRLGSSHNVFDNITVHGRHLGVEILSGSHGNVFQCNVSSNNRIGVLNNLGALGNRFRYNLFADNHPLGARNTDTTSLDMRENFWGAPDGPGPSGSGNAISGPIDFLPFFGAAEDLDGLCGRTQPSTADLEVQKTAGCGDALPGGLVVYTFTVSNHGPDEATGVVLEDPLPPELSWVSDTCGAGPLTGPLTTAPWTWQIGSLDVGSSESCEVTVRIDPDLEQAVVVRNTATVTSEGVDPNPGNNTAQAVLYPRLDPSLAGWWPLDETSGSVADDASGSGGAGTLRNGPQWTVGQQSGALEFDGEDDYVEIVDPCSPLDLVDALTIALWVRPDTLGQSARELVSKDNAYELEIGKVSPDTYSVRLNNVIQGAGQTPIEVGVWQHLAMTWDGFTVRYYYDGLADGSASFNGMLDLSPDNVGLGGRPGPANANTPVFFFDGRLDDIRLYRRALSDEEIADLVDTTLRDSVPPVRSIAAPAQVLPAGTTQATLSLTTDEAATCRHSTSADIPYAEMGGSFAVTGGTSHSINLSGLVDEQILALFVRCQDALGNANPDDLRILLGVGSTDVSSGLVSHWTFDEGAGCDALDETGTNDATLGPSCPTDSPQWISGRSGGALALGGGAQEALVSSPTLLSPLTEVTLSAWIRHAPTAGTFHAILDQRDAGNDGFDLYLEPTSRLLMRVNNTTLTSNGVVADGRWHHVVGVYDGTQLRLYVDGVLDIAANAPMTTLDTGSALHLGRNFATSDYSLVGDLDEVQIHDRALSAVEVVELFAQAP